MKRASYREGINWIAQQDPAEKDVSRIAKSSAVKLLAYTYEKTIAEVAEDVAQIRIETKKRK